MHPQDIVICTRVPKRALSVQVETVPSAMLYWLTVESVRRALAPYTIGGEPATCDAP